MHPYLVFLVAAVLACRQVTCSFDGDNNAVGEFGVDALVPGSSHDEGVDALRSLIVAKYNPGDLGDRYNERNIRPSTSQAAVPQGISTISPRWQPEYLQQARPAGFGGFDCTLTLCVVHATIPNS